MTPTKGFVTIATGKEHYYKIAQNLLRSYRFSTKKTLPFAILCDQENEFTKEFDDVRFFENPTCSYLDKLNMFALLPYDINIFIDADCIAFRDINNLFDIFESADDFCCYGDVLPLDHKRCWFDYKNLNEDLQKQINYGVDLHGGIYYIRKTEKSKKVFEDAKRFSENYADYNFRSFAKPADEPVIALSMALNKVKPQEHIRTSITCYWEHEKQFELNILNGIALCKPNGLTTDIIHWGTTHTQSIAYKKVISDLESVTDYRKTNKITLVDYIHEISMYIKRFIASPKNALVKILNLIKHH